MTTQRLSLHSCDRCSGGNQVQCNTFWSELQNWLKPYVLSWIFAERLPTWRCQEYEIADDVLQETSIRILRYLRPALDGDAHAIQSVEHFSLAVAHNVIRDLARRQRRLVRLTPSSSPFEYEKAGDTLDFSELALEQLLLEDLFLELAHIINEFPPMQRRAILTDLAKYEDCDEESRLLLAAFLKLDINLRDYRRPRALDTVERNKQASLLSIAYKRLRRTYFGTTQKYAA
jgi:DNA-directed RNA polymerase specialized sigma24 family protein